MVAVVGVAIVAFAFLLDRRSGPKPPDAPISVAEDPAPELRLRGERNPGPEVDAGRRDLPGRVIAVRDARTKEAIADACIVADVPGPSFPFPTASSHVVARTREDGVAQVVGGAVRSLLVWAEGHVPAAVTMPENASAVVDLEPAAPLVVTCTDVVGNPVPGVRVLLRVAGSLRSRWPDQVPAFGHPGAEDPVWAQTTDERGVASFDCLPRLKYQAVAAAEGRLCITSLGRGKDVMMPPANVSLMFDEMWATCFRLPAGVEAASWHFDVEQSSLDISPEVRDALEANIAALKEKWPGCICLVGRPVRTDRELVVACRAIAKDGSSFAASWPMQRMSRVAPVFMEPSGAKAVPVRVVVRNKRGEPVPMSIEVFDVTRRATVEPDAAGTLLLLPGRHKIVPVPMSTWLVDQLVPEDFVVAAGSEDLSVVTVLQRDLVKLRVVPEMQGEELLSPAHVRITDGAGGNVGIAWRPGVSVEAWVPEGLVSIEVGGPAYESAKADVVLTGSAEMKIPFAAKKR